MSIVIQHPGAHTTVQDLGRTGRRGAGVPQGGAVDGLALRIANLLVGNDEDAAALECTLVGARVEFQIDTLAAVCGAPVEDVRTWTTLAMRAGEVLDLSRIRSQAYVYLAIAGGIDVPRVLGSRSTDTRLAVGGVGGRRLLAGDQLALAAPRRCRIVGDWRINAEPWYGRDTVRVIRGRHAHVFDLSALDKQFEISGRSDRMGVRLIGSPLRCEQTGLSQSAPVVPGTIQVPPDGQPIVLLADAQTLGGYLQIAHVAGVDLPRMAQLRTGSRVRFSVISLDEAHELSLARARELAMIREAVSDKLR